MNNQFECNLHQDPAQEFAEVEDLHKTWKVLFAEGADVATYSTPVRRRLDCATATAALRCALFRKAGKLDTVEQQRFTLERCEP